MRRAWGLTFILLAACGAPPRGANEPARAVEEEPARPSGPVVASEGAVNRPASAQPIAPAPPPPPPAEAGELISVTPGFRPDPVVRRGRAGGPVSAERIHPDCRGFVAAEPSFVLKLDQAMPSLRLLTHMQGDATLLVELADGRVMCNDDREGLNAIVEGAFPPGLHRVFVGTYGRRGTGTPYTFAVTTQPALTTYAIESLPPTR